jgi:hypothetical protein
LRTPYYFELPGQVTAQPVQVQRLFCALHLMTE